MAVLLAVKRLFEGHNAGYAAPGFGDNES